MSRDRSFSPVADVTGEQEEGRVLIEGQLNERVPGRERRLAQRVGDFGRGAVEPVEWDIQVQISCVNEAKRWP